jgi:hypothetical protein
MVAYCEGVPSEVFLWILLFDALFLPTTMFGNKKSRLKAGFMYSLV